MSTATDRIAPALQGRAMADAGLTALIGQRVSLGVMPTGTPLPYLSIETPTEEPFETFSTEGNETFVWLKVWTLRRDEAQLNAITVELHRIFNNRPLPIGSGTFISGRLRMIAGAVPDDVTKAYQRILEYRALSQVA